MRSGSALRRHIRLTNAERDEFERAVEALPERIPTPPPPRTPPPSAATVLKELRTGKRRISDDCECSIRQMTQSAARLRLETFLRSSRDRRRRAVRVVHGFGHRSPGGRSALRERVPDWLGDWKPELVEAWEVTPRKDGGKGALFVVLTPRTD